MVFKIAPWGTYIPENSLQSWFSVQFKSFRVDRSCFLGTATTAAVPGDDRFGLHQGQRPAPSRPGPHQDDPEQAIPQLELGLGVAVPQDVDLPAKRQVLQEQVSQRGRKRSRRRLMMM